MEAAEKLKGVDFASVIIAQKIDLLYEREKITIEPYQPYGMGQGSDCYYGGFRNNFKHGFGIQKKWIAGDGGMNNSVPIDYTEAWEAYKDGMLVYYHTFAEFSE